MLFIGEIDRRHGSGSICMELWLLCAFSDSDGRRNHAKEESSSLVLRGRENPPSHFLPEDAMPESRSAITHAMPKSSTVCIALGLGLLLLPLIPFAANGQTCMDCRASFGCEQKDRQCANSCKAYQFGSAARNACNKNCIVVVKSCMDAASNHWGFWCGPYAPGYIQGLPGSH